MLVGILTTGTEGLVGASPIWGPICTGSDRRRLRSTIRFEMTVPMCMKVARWSRTGLGHRAEVFDTGTHVRRLWEVDQFWFRKGFDGDFEFEQDREGYP